MNINFNQWNDKTFQEEEKLLKVDKNIFNKQLLQSDFKDITDFENNYNSDDILYSLIGYLDNKEFNEKKEYYKLLN